MIIRILFIFVCFLAAMPRARAERASSGGYRFFAVTGGLESRLERDQEQNIVDRSLSNWGLGFGYDDFYFSLEYSSFNESTGQNSLVIERQVESYMAWGQWFSGAWSSLIPFIGAGVGQSVETLDTTLLSLRSRDKGRPQIIGGGNVGVRANMPYLWLSFELRLLAAERWDPNPSAGFLGRLGFYF